MKIEIAAICDAATDQSGKLNMLGVFDYIEAELPIVIPRCSTVFRIRYSRSEATSHDLKVTIQNQFDDSELIPPIITSVNFLPVPEDMDSAAVNLILNINRMRVTKGGKYLMRLRIDEVLLETALPIYITDLTPKEPNPLAS
ncbi:MAG: hypothetical protein K6A31_00545 [Fibrobacter sp.]|nr:hypothetical protein [Fibrobacter sp.]